MIPLPYHDRRIPLRGVPPFSQWEHAMPDGTVGPASPDPGMSMDPTTVTTNQPSPRFGGIPPEILRMLRGERLSQLGAGLLAQSGYSPVAPTLGEAFGKAAAGLPSWSQTIMSTMANVQAMHEAQKKQDDEDQINRVMAEAEPQRGEDRNIALARVLPRLAALGPAGREAASAIAQTLGMLAPDVADLGGGLAKRNKLTGEIYGPVTPKIPTYDQLSTAAQQAFTNTSQLHDQFVKETDADQVRGEAWQQLYANNSFASQQEAGSMDKMSRAVGDQFFLYSLLNILQPENKLDPLKGVLPTISKRDSGFIASLKQRAIDLLSGTDAEPLSVEERANLQNVARRVMTEAQGRFSKKARQFQERAAKGGLDTSQIITDYYDLPGMRQQGSAPIYDQGNQLLNQGGRRARRPR